MGMGASLGKGTPGGLAGRGGLGAGHVPGMCGLSLRLRPQQLGKRVGRCEAGPGGGLA